MTVIDNQNSELGLFTDSTIWSIVDKRDVDHRSHKRFKRSTRRGLGLGALYSGKQA
jgi:hypothetical protein